MYPKGQFTCLCGGKISSIKHNPKNYSYVFLRTDDVNKHNREKENLTRKILSKYSWNKWNFYTYEKYICKKSLMIKRKLTQILQKQCLKTIKI